MYLKSTVQRYRIQMLFTSYCVCQIIEMAVDFFPDLILHGDLENNPFGHSQLNEGWRVHPWYCLSMAMPRSTYSSSHRSPTYRLDKVCGLLHPTIYSFLLSDCLVLDVAPSLSPLAGARIWNDLRTVDVTSAPSLRKRLTASVSTFISWPEFYKLSVSPCGPCGSCMLLRPPTKLLIDWLITRTNYESEKVRVPYTRRSN